MHKKVPRACISISHRLTWYHVSNLSSFYPHVSLYHLLPSFIIFHLSPLSSFIILADPPSSYQPRAHLDVLLETEDAGDHELRTIANSIHCAVLSMIHWESDRAVFRVAGTVLDNDPRIVGQDQFQWHYNLDLRFKSWGTDPMLYWIDYCWCQKMDQHHRSVLRQLPFLRTFHPACYCTCSRAQFVQQSMKLLWHGNFMGPLLKA